jgi:hypothetical protein
MPSAENFEWPQGNPLFEVQWRTVTESLAGNGIVNNGDFEVTATATDMEISVAAGTAFYVGSNYNLGATETHVLSDGDANDDRWDTVYFDTGTASSGVREGTPAANPEPPDISGGELLLAVVYVPAGATNISDQEILNWRAKFSNEAEEVHYDDSTGVYGINNVDAALDELQEAAQLTQYPISPGTDLDVNGYPFQNSDLSNSTVTVNAGTGLGTTNASIGLGGSATVSIETDGVTSTELADAVDLETMRTRDNSITGQLASLPTNWGTISPLICGVVDGNSAAGNLHQFTFDINDLNFLTIAAESDGAGGLQNQRVSLDSALALLAQSGAPGYSGQGATFYDTDEETPKYANSTGTYQRPLPRTDVKQFDENESGTVNSGNVGVMWATSVPDGGTLEVLQGMLLLDTLEPAPTDLDLVIYTGDNAGAATFQTTVIDGDGATVHDDQTGSPLASYTNSSGGALTTAIGIDNGQFNAGTGAAQDIIAQAQGRVI